jgi:hypothetical protein
VNPYPNKIVLGFYETRRRRSEANGLPASGVVCPPVLGELSRRIRLASGRVFTRVATIPVDWATTGAQKIRIISGHLNSSRAESSGEFKFKNNFCVNGHPMGLRNISVDNRPAGRGRIYPTFDLFGLWHVK